MASQPLPLSIIADVTVVTSSPQVAAPTFNTGLVIGPSTAIPSYGANSRIRKYLAATYSTSMISDGFATTDPEYICAQIYFSQSPQPQALFIGRQDLTAISAAAPTVGSIGTGYVVGDVVGVTQNGASNGQLRVTTVGANGTVTGIAIIVGQQGTGYAIGSALPTTGGSGTDLQVSITAIGESALQASMVCRSIEPTWYPFMVTDAMPADHIAISAWVLSQTGTVYFGNDSEATVLNGEANNTFKELYASSSSRTWMQYASTQGGLVPNQIYFTAAVMGQAMASNTQLANSAFTEKFSGGVPLKGVVVEQIGITQISNIEGSVSGLGPNGNLFLNYANAFNVLEQGTMMAENVFFDQILNLDLLAANIQFKILSTLSSLPKVPQTDSGQQLLVQAVEAALSQSVNTGFIASGIWEGQTINLGGSQVLKPGQALPSGYLVLTPSYANWAPTNQAAIQARQAPPIYIAFIEAGAVHFVTVQVLVQV